MTQQENSISKDLEFIDLYYTEKHNELDWKPGFYEINRLGDIRGPDGEIVNQSIAKGVYKVSLQDDKAFDNTKDRARTMVNIHLLMARTFLEKSMDDSQTSVLHLDGDTLHNHPSNLEWCTLKELKNVWDISRIKMTLLKQGKLPMNQ